MTFASRMYPAPGVYFHEKSLSRRFDAKNGSLCAALLLAALYAAAVCANGVPALRHDWWWPISRGGFADVFWNSVSGWIPNGIGYPYPYPGTYIAGSVIAIIGFLLGPLGALALFAFGMGLMCTLGARHLALSLHAAPMQLYAVELFAIANPWIYNQTVAGHIYMILAFGALLALTGEMLAQKPQPARMSMFLVAALAQLQFFLVAMVCAAVYAALRRSLTPLITGVVAALPIWIGLAMDRSNLLNTPYTLSWQLSQSVPAANAIVLSGYFAEYAGSIARMQQPALWVLVACAAIAVFASRNRAYAVGAAAVAVVFLIFAMGVQGPLATTYAQIVTRIPESGVFRELYDLLGFVAICYAVLLALGPSSRAFSAVALVAAAVLAAAWFAVPPSTYWINSETIRTVSFTAPENTRFALFPAFQPMSYEGRGSGADRDAYSRGGNVTSLNQYQARYPVDAALAAFVLGRDDTLLRALSVSTIVDRPWLQTNQQSLSYQANLSRNLRAITQFRVARISPLPEMTIGQLPLLGSLVNRLGSGNELFSDARAGTIVPIEPSNALVDESKGWSDVRFDFIAHPDLAQGIGGAVTTNRTAVLPVASGEMTLVNVNGTLRSMSGRVIARNSAGYRWIRAPARVNALQCTGRCVVAAQTAQTVLPPLNPAARRSAAVPFELVTPWLARAQVPPGPSQALRYNVAFDPNWTAVAGNAILPHMRLDATVNGWTVPRRDRTAVVYVFHLAGVLQSFGEVAGVLWIFALLVQALLRRRSGAFEAARTRS